MPTSAADHISNATLPSAGRLYNALYSSCLHTNDQSAVPAEGWPLGHQVIGPHQFSEALIQKQNSEIRFLS